MATPSAISTLSHRERSCSSSVTSRPASSVRAGEPGVLEQHQREQATRLGLGRGEGELAGEPDGVAGQVVAAAVTGVVDERQDAQHDREVAQLAKVAATHGALGAADPLRHGRLRNEERVGDLAGGQPTDGPKGEGDLRRRRELGMTAQEQQQQRVIALLGRPLGLLDRHRLLACPARRLTAPCVDESPHGHGAQPGGRVTRRVLGPDPQRLDDRLLHGILGSRELLPAAQQAGEHVRCERPDELVEPVRSPLGAPSQDITSRTSIHSYSGSPPGPGSDDTNAANSSARSMTLDVDHVPTGDQVARLRVRAVRHDRGGVRARRIAPTCAPASGPGRRRTPRDPGAACSLR